MKGKVMDFWRDKRGVSVILGAILMFMIVAALYSTVQAYQVPIWNQAVEYEHLNMAYDDMMSLKSNVENVALLSAPKSSNIRMGIRYPNRMFLINPGPGVAGTVRTEQVSVTVQCTYNTPGNPTLTKTYNSQRIVYEAYGTVTGPRLVYEHGVIIKDYGNASVTSDEQRLIVANEIYIPVLIGELAPRASMETESITLRPLTETETTPGRIQSAKITLETAYPQVWHDLFDASANITSANITYSVNQVVINVGLPVRQGTFPKVEVTTPALYAGLIRLSTAKILDPTTNYPRAVGISISTVSGSKTVSTITATVKNATAPFDIHAGLDELTGDPLKWDVLPDYSSHVAGLGSGSITAASWPTPNENIVKWTNITHREYAPGESVMVGLWVYNSELNREYYTQRVFTRASASAWYGQ